MINPFRHKIVTNPWDNEDCDVPEINARPFDACMDAYEDVRQTRRSGSVLLHGEAGSGKTHLLRKLRAHLNQENARHVFISVRLQSGHGRFWSHIRKCFADSLYQKSFTGKEQLQFVLSNRFTAFLKMQGRRPPPRSLDEFKVAFRDFTDSKRLPQNHHNALYSYCFRSLRRDAVSWLRGDPLPDGILKRLGITMQSGEPADPEDEARDLILSICRLGGAEIPFILSFDQVEAMQREPNDKTALFVFGKAVRLLHDETRNLLIVTCVQSFFETYLRETMMEPDYAALALSRGSLRPLNREEAVKLARTRLSLRPDYAAGDISHNLTRHLEAFFSGGRNRQTARAVLSFCADRLDELEAGVVQPIPTAPSDTPTDAPTDAADIRGVTDIRDTKGIRNTAVGTESTESFLNERLNRRVEKNVGHISPEKMDEILHGTLPDFMNLLNPEWKQQDHFTAEESTRLRDVDILLEGKGEKVGICLCNEKSMTSLSSRLRRLSEMKGGDGPDRLLLFRHTELPITSGAKKARTYLKKLIGERGRLIQPSSEVLAVLDAMGRLLADAKAGDLDHKGEIVNAGTVQEWVKSNLPDGPRDLLGKISSRKKDAGQGDVELMQDLMGLLNRAKVARLSHLARELEISPEALETIAAGHTEQIGFLEGPPPLLFLKVSAGLVTDL